MAEAIVGYDVRLYAHVDPGRGEVLRCVIDPASAGDPTYVDGPERLAERAPALCEDEEPSRPPGEVG